jgi:threonine dehydrogenase-like Zn-dependent dehydrogenase
MKVAYLVGKKKIVIEEEKEPEIRNDNDVLVRIKCVGICGSDVHYFLEGKIGDQIVKDRIILGHEASGEVVVFGKNVKKLRKGDKVAIEPGISCGKCEFCIRGRPNICPFVRFLGTLSILFSAREGGANRIFVSDLIDERIEFAKKIGADFTVNANKEDITEIVKKITDNRGVDISFESAGKKETFRQVFIQAELEEKVFLLVFLLKI